MEATALHPPLARSSAGVAATSAGTLLVFGGSSGPVDEASGAPPFPY